MSLKDVIHFDQGDVLKHEVTPEGFLNCYMRVAKIGDLQYRNADGSTRTEYVSKDSLFNTDSVTSLKGKPVTFEHPPALLTAETAKDYLTGSTLNLVKYDGSFLGIMATIHDKPTIDAILSGKAREVSCGYTCDLVKRADGTFEQRNRQYNHVAITRKGRAGNSVAVHMDSVDDAKIWTQIRGDSMSDFQIEIAGKVTRVDAETYDLIRQEQQQRLDAEKKMSAMAAKMAKLRAMQSDAPEEDEDEDMEEDMPMMKSKAKKDASCGTRKDAKKVMPEPEEEDMEEEDEYDRKDAFDHTDSADTALLETLIENRLLKARLDTESKESSEDEEEDPEEDEDDEDYGAKKRKDAADILNTWIAVADELTPALIRGDAIVEGIEIEDGNLHFDSVDATDLKEAYIKLHKLDDLLSETDRYDSLAIATVFNIAKKSQSRLDSNAPKSRSRETLDSAFKGKRHDSSDIRYTSIQEDYEAGRKRLNR